MTQIKYLQEMQWKSSEFLVSGSLASNTHRLVSIEYKIGNGHGILCIALELKSRFHWLNL